MSFNVRFTLGPKAKCLTISVTDPAEAERIAKEIFPEGTGFKAEPVAAPVSKSSPLTAPPPQVMEAEKPKFLK